jgi:hypothetical protein
MAPKVKKTRLKSEELYAGGPKELPQSDLPTNSDIARYYYLVSASEFDFKKQIEIVKDKLVQVWEKCNPALPLQPELGIYVKIKRFLEQVKNFNRKQKIGKAAKFLVDKQDKLFDIAACSCKLPNLPCESRQVRCSAEPGKCESRHLVCECPPEKRVPAEEREYLLDQRTKIGTKGLLQLGPVDRAAAARRAKLEERRASAVVEQSLQSHKQTSINPDLSFDVSVRVFKNKILDF